MFVVRIIIEPTEWAECKFLNVKAIVTYSYHGTFKELKSINASELFTVSSLFN
jgi:hypothetical protein